MSQISYLLDENVHALFRTELLRREPAMRVWQVGMEGAPPLSTSDPLILLWCEAQGFILITNNRSSMPVHLSAHLAQGHHVPGIFILNNNMGVGNSLEELVRVWRNPAPERYRDTITFLPVTR